MDLHTLRSSSCITKEWLLKMLQSNLDVPIYSLEYKVEEPSAESSHGFLSEVAFVKICINGKNRQDHKQAKHAKGVDQGE